MNRAFMEQIYEALYEDPEGEFGKNNSEYTLVVHRAYRDIENAEKLAEQYGEDMSNALEKVLDSVAIQTSFSIRLAYLRGAEDREKMLR